MHIEIDLLRRLGLSQATLAQLGQALTTDDGTRLMRVVQTQRDRHALHDGRDVHVARLLPAAHHALQAGDSQLTVGDWVLAGPDAHGDVWIGSRLEPATQIARRANDGRRQALASNVDTALLVMGLDADFNPRRMERSIAMVRASGVAPVAVLSKVDLGAEARHRVALLRERLPKDVPVVAVDGTRPQARTELQPWLGPAQTLVLLGASGAGKSTLTNTLLRSDVQQTGGVRSSDGRGRHTTTARSLHLCEGGACIIDTPGLRTWRPDADGHALAATFDDVQALAHGCRYRDCRHEGEPGCAVRAEVPADRLRNYQKLLRDAERGEQTPLQRIVLRRKWKTLRKAGTLRVQDKRR
ncbi:MAG: ribosome small subunit-dependent GTPase A [Ramlibacter sp.]